VWASSRGRRSTGRSVRARCRAAAARRGASSRRAVTPPPGTGGDGGAGGHRGQARQHAACDEGDEFGHGRQVGVGVTGLDTVDGVLDVARDLPVVAAVPDLDDATAGVADVLEPPLGADDGVVAPVVGREVALLVTGHHPVVERHHHHRHVLDVDDRVQAGRRRRRPVLEREPVVDGLPGALVPVRHLAVDHEVAHADHALRVGAREQVHHVDVVARLLQQKGAGLRAVGVPVLEVVVAAVADEVAHPDALDLADLAPGDHVAHQPDDRGVPEVVPDVEGGAGLGRDGEDRVGVGHGGRERLLEVDRDARSQQVDRDGGVGRVRGGDDGRVDEPDERPVRGHDLDAGELLGGSTPPLGRRVGRGDEHGGVAGGRDVVRDVGPLPDSDHADAQRGRRTGRRVRGVTGHRVIAPLREHDSNVAQTIMKRQ